MLVDFSTCSRESHAGLPSFVKFFDGSFFNSQASSTRTRRVSKVEQIYKVSNRMQVLDPASPDSELAMQKNSGTCGQIYGILDSRI